jgi:hypothetical protein
LLLNINFAVSEKIANIINNIGRVT